MTSRRKKRAVVGSKERFKPEAIAGELANVAKLTARIRNLQRAAETRGLRSGGQLEGGGGKDIGKLQLQILRSAALWGRQRDKRTGITIEEFRGIGCNVAVDQHAPRWKTRGRTAVADSGRKREGRETPDWDFRQQI